MLPKLSKTKSVMFQAAEPEPAYISARRNALLNLKSINEIRVSSSGNGSKTCYTIEVFADSLQCRTTSNTTSTTSSDSINGDERSRPQSYPVAQSERGLEEFVELRDKLYKTMFQAHSSQYCSFWSHVLDPVISGVDPDGVFITLFGKQRTLRKLTTFLGDLLAPTVRYACASAQECCSAQILVPQVLHSFLYTQS